VSIESPCMTCY